MINKIIKDPSGNVLFYKDAIFVEYQSPSAQVTAQRGGGSGLSIVDGLKRTDIGLGPLELVKASGESIGPQIWTATALKEALAKDFFFEGVIPQERSFEAGAAGLSYSTGIFLPLDVEAAYTVIARAVITTQGTGGTGGQFAAFQETRVTAKTLGGGANLYSSTVLSTHSQTTFPPQIVPQNYIQPFFGSPSANNEILYRVQPSTISENLFFNVDFEIYKNVL